MHYLNQCFPESVVLSMKDVKGLQDATGGPGTAKEMAKYFAQKRVSKNDIIIASGYFANYWPESYHIIYVVHGLWANWFKVNKVGPWQGFCEAQEGAIKRVPVVTTSLLDYNLVKKIYGVKSTVIRNGIDTDIFCPGNRVHRMGEPFVILHAAHDGNKQKSAMPWIQKFMDNMHKEEDVNFQIQLEYLRATMNTKPFRWRTGDIFLQISRSEGFGYALVEAMASGLAPISSPVGIAPEIPEWACISTEANKEKACAAILYTIEDDFYLKHMNPRKWVLENYTLDIFKNNWAKYLKDTFSYESPSNTP